MKPIYIEMKAFGSYQDERIDFTDIDSGVFLITGDTGAGKTTIFDAVTYALYGRTSGGKRDGEMMCSQYAMQGKRTEVRFRFSYCKKEYTVIRSPEQPNWKRKVEDGKEYFVPLKNKSPAKVELILPDGASFVGRKREIDRKIEEIIGLGAEQFVQVAMLAQGDFIKLLHASSEERKEIFARIFDTEVYAQIEAETARCAKEMHVSLVKNKEDIIRELERVSCPLDSGLGKAWEAYPEKFSESDAGGLLRAVHDILSECIQKREEAGKGSAEAKSKLEYISLQIQTAENVNKIFDDLEKELAHEKKLKEQKSDIEALEDKMKKAKAALLVKNAYEKRAEWENIVKERQERIDSLFSWITDCTESLKEQKDAAERAAKQYEDESPALFTRIGQINESLADYDALAKLKKESDSLEKEIRSANERLILLQQEKEKCERQQKSLSGDLYQNFYLRCLEQQIPILRAGLKEGEPCPVCGSLHHEADGTHQAPELISREFRKKEEELEEMEQQLEALGRKLETQKEEMAQERIRKAECDTKLSRIEETLEFADKKEAQRNLKEIKKRLETLKKEKEEREASYQELNRRFQEKTGMLSSERENFVSDRENLRLAGAEYEASLKEQGFYDTDSFLAAVLEQKEIENSEVLMKQYQMEAVLTAKNLERLLTEADGRERIDVTGLHAKKQELKEMLTELEKEEREMFRLESVNREAYEKGCSLYKQREKLRERTVLLDNLDSTANGRISKKRMNFQTYIQRRYFKQIIDLANRRLYPMSGNQFILHCRDIKDLGTQGAVGLDLDVYSVVNDQTRDVKTLSGGESFMAALSMALGMADMIQNSRGSVHIDTMFIDEGFGTLSEETRNQAIEILNELSGENRLVGIISHVSELKAQIGTKLVVTKTDQGSHAEWEET